LQRYPNTAVGQAGEVGSEQLLITLGALPVNVDSRGDIASYVALVEHPNGSLVVYLRLA
jgi:hypothetical protein